MRTVADYNRAKALLDVNRYAECMELVDLVMGIPHYANNEEISETLRRDWIIGVDPSQFSNIYVDKRPGAIGVTIEDNDIADMRSFGVLGLIDLMRLRSRCLSAIFFSPDRDLKERYQDSVLLNVYIIFELIPLELPGAPGVWRVAAQSLLCFERHTGLAIDMMVDAIRSLDSDRPAEQALDMASSKDFAPERHLLATTIPQVIAAYRCSDEVKQRVAELQALVDPVTEQRLINPKKPKHKRGFGRWLLVTAILAVAIVSGLSALNSRLHSTFAKISSDLVAPPR